MDAREREGKEKALLKAAKKGDTGRVQQLLAEGVNPDAGGGYRHGSSLHSAAYHGHRGTVSALLRAGADVNAWDNKQGKRTPLHKAAENGHHETVSVLLTAGADVDARNEWEYTALHLAAIQGHPKCAEILLQHGADTSIKNEKGRTAEEIAADENTWGSFAHNEHQKERVTRGRKEILKLLREHKDKWKALHKAAYNGHHETVSALLSSGADVNARDNKQKTPLHLAAENGHHETVSALLTAGADVNARDNEQSSPLHDAAWNGHHETVSVLLTAVGADVNARDDEQRTPLYLAAYNGHHGTVSALLTAGADVNAWNDEQGTPLHWAAWNGHHETVSVLLTAGADVDARDVEESTPLHDAASRGHPKCVEILLQHGADTSIRNEKGRTAEDIAADEDTTGAFANNKDEEELIIHGRKEILRLLREGNNRVSKRKKGFDPVLVRYFEEGMTKAKKDCPSIQEAAKASGKTEEEVRTFIGNYRKSLGDKKQRQAMATDDTAAGYSGFTGYHEDSGMLEEPDEFEETTAEWLAEQQESGTSSRTHEAVEQHSDRNSPTDEGESSEKSVILISDEEETSQVQLADGSMIVRNEASQIQAKKGDSSVPLEIQLRGPEMQQLYYQACRQGARPVHSVRGLVVGQFRSGKTCVVRRLTGEKAVENEPITDGIEISPSVMTKTWWKAREEPDEFKETMAERLAEKQQERNNPHPQTSSQTQGAVRKKTTEDPGKAQKTTRKQHLQMQQERSMEKHTPTQRQETPKLKKEDEKEGRAESVTKTMSQQTQDIPDDVIKKAKERLQSGVAEEQLGTAEHPRISLWDFGGQATYYGSHQCFFTYRGIYILVMSLLQKLSDPVPDLDYKASADNLVTGRDYLDHWLNSVRTHTLVHGREQTGEPPVVLVLTHKGRVSESDIEEYKKDILDHISGKAAGKHVLPKIFVIDNFDKDNSDIDELREYLREVAKGLWFMGQEVPMTWLHLKSKLMDKRREDVPFCRFQDVVDLARSDDVGITDDSHVADILTFLHDLGDIIFINEPVLRDHVTLLPQVMIDVFKTIITVPEYQQDRSTGGEVAEMWRRLENEGILSDRLLTIIWTKADQKMQKPFFLRHKSFLKRLMEKYYLLCNATPIGGFGDTAGKPEKEEIYFVPSLLSAKPDDSTLYPGHMRRGRRPLYVVFDNMFLPSGMFYRLQAICVRRFGLEESHVFAGCGRFPTDDVKQQFVVTKVKHYLKVELLWAEDQTEFTQGLPVRKFLSSCLFEIKEKWIPSIQYDWCFGEESGEETGTPVFHPLSDIEQETATGSSRFPEDFSDVWMGGSGDTRTPCAENSGGSGPVMIEPKVTPDDMKAVHTIGPVLDCMETCRGLSLAQCDRIRHELTSVSRFKKLVATVDRSGDMCRRLLGASVEVCLPERAPMFPREERGNEIVLLHVGDYHDKLVQPLLKQLVQSSSRYGVTVSEDFIEPGDIITDKLLGHLLQRNVRMIVPIITPQTLHSRHWSTLGYEFCVQNKNLIFPVFAYPDGTRERLLEVLGRRCAGMLDMASTEVPMTEEKTSSTKISLTATQILRKASSSVVLYTRQITEEGCTVVEDGVTISFPKGCVKKKRFVSLEVDMLPIDETMAKSFSAVTPVMTVHLDTEEDFLKPVNVTLPWTWKGTCNLGRTILMKRSTDHWSTLSTEVRETKDTITFTACHFCSVVGAKKKDSAAEDSSTGTSTEQQDEAANQEETKAIDVLVTRYGDDKVHLIISPNEATTDDKRIHLLCIEKDKKVTDYFRADNFKTPPPFQQEVIMDKKERIRARFGEEEDVIGDPRDIPPEPPGIQFVFPPANCNRKSVRLKLRDPQIGKGKFEGAVHFTLLSEAGEPVRDPIRRIDSAHVYLHSLQGKKKSGKRQSSLRSDSPALAKKARRDGVTVGRSNQVSVSLSFPQAAQSEQDEGGTSQVQQKEGTVITMTKASQIQHKKGGKRKAKTRHVGESSDSEPPVKRSKQESVLLVNDKYGKSHGGPSTTNREVALFLQQNGATVHATALQASEEDKRCADEDGIHLILPAIEPGDPRTPCLEMLTFDHESRYPDIPRNLNCIVGHSDVTCKAAKRIKRDCCKEAKLVLFNHDIPEETEQFKGTKKAMAAGKKMKDILEDAKNADAVFSLGKRIYNYFETKYKSLGESKPSQHFLFRPRPSPVFEAISVSPEGGEKVVLSVGRVTEVDKLKGHDLVARAMGEVADKITNIRLCVRGIDENDFDASRRILEENLHSGKIKPTLLPCGTQEDIAQDMQQAHLVLMPSRAEPFGLIGLEAIAAGIPVLISDKSGLADMIKDLIKEEKCPADMRHRIVKTSVKESDLEETAKRWAEKIEDSLDNSTWEFKKAAEYKKEILESKYWEESHQNLLRVCGLSD